MSLFPSHFYLNITGITALSNDGSMYAMKDMFGNIIIKDLNNNVISELEVNSNSFSLYFSNDGKKIFSVSENLISVWDIKSSKLLYRITINPNEGANIYISSSKDNKHIIYFSNNILNVWDSSYMNYQLEYEKNLEYLVDNEKLWEKIFMKNRDKNQTLDIENQKNISVSFDLKTLILKFKNNIIEIWDIPSQTFVQKIKLDKKKDYLFQVVSNDRKTIALTLWNEEKNSIKNEANNSFSFDISLKSSLEVYDVKSGIREHYIKDYNNIVLKITDDKVLLGANILTQQISILDLKNERKLFDFSSYNKENVYFFKIDIINDLNNSLYVSNKINFWKQQLQSKLEGITLVPTQISFDKPQWSKHHPFHWIDDAENGDAEAMYQLGLIYDRDNENQKALEWYKKASAQGHKEAEEQLVFLEGWVKKNS